MLGNFSLRSSEAIGWTKGYCFAHILQRLDELGYDVQWFVLNSKFFGVPQNRERVFIIGSLRGEPRPEILPFNPTEQKTDKPSMQFAGGVKSGKMWLEDGKDFSRNYPQGQRIYTTEGISAQINAQGGGWGAKTGLYAIPMRWSRTEKGKEFRKEAMKQGKDLTPFGEEHRELIESKEEISGCITGALAKDSLLKQNMKIRRLTPRECERLQGFPEGWTLGFSDTQRYKMMGNAVTVNVISAIAKNIF